MASQLEGVADLTAQLNELGLKVVGRELRGTAKEAISHAEDLARQYIPVGDEAHKTYNGRLVSPGFAQASIKSVTRINKRTGAVEAILGVSREAFYATQFVEVGTSKMPAKPWLRPAFEASKDSMLSEIATQLRDRMARIKKRMARRFSK